LLLKLYYRRRNLGHVWNEEIKNVGMKGNTVIICSICGKQRNKKQKNEMGMAVWNI
jgi:hypothetical protein